MDIRYSTVYPATYRYTYYNVVETQMLKNRTFCCFIANWACLKTIHNYTLRRFLSLAYNSPVYRIKCLRGMPSETGLFCMDIKCPENWDVIIVVVVDVAKIASSPACLSIHCIIRYFGTRFNAPNTSSSHSPFPSFFSSPPTPLNTHTETHHTSIHIIIW